MPRPLALKRTDREAPALEPLVRVAAVRAGPGMAGPGPDALTSRRGLSDTDGDGLLELGTASWFAQTFPKSTWNTKGWVNIEMPETQ